MTTRFLLAIAILASVAACKIGGDETNTGAAAACFEVGTACAGNSDCCSYGCLAGLCAENPAEGGTCRTTNDCVFGRLCKSGACTTETLGMCRDTADVCTVGYSGTLVWGDCCSGNCEVGRCTTNNAPTANAGPDVADAPYTKLVTLTNLTTDADGDPLTYGWSFTSMPTGAAVSFVNPAATNQTFTPNKPGRYIVRLVVTEGPAGAPDRYVLQDDVTIDVVNTSPIVTARTPASATEWSRNVPITITGAVSDPDGDVLDCAWRVTAPGETTPTEVVAPGGCNSGAPSYTFSPPGEGPYLVELVVRDYDRYTPTQVVHSTVGGVTFTSKNDPPVAATTRFPYYANMGATLGTTPSVTLDASPSTDPNNDHLFDPFLSFSWELLSYPGTTAPAFANSNDAVQTFTPNAEGNYVFRLTASDAAQFGRASATDTLEVSVEVGRYIQPLAGTIADAARAKDANRIVLAGVEGGKGKVWVYDVTTRTVGAGIELIDPVDPSIVAAPRLVDVTPDGTKAVVVDQGVSIWVVTLGVTPSVVRAVKPFTSAIGDVVVAGNRFAYLFSAGSYDTVRELDLNSGTAAITIPTGWPGYGTFGTAYSVGSTSYLYRVDGNSHTWYRHPINPSGGSGGTYVYGSTAPMCGASYATAMWAVQNADIANAFVVTSCGTSYRADTLASLGTSIAVSPSFVDSTSGGAFVASVGGQLDLFNSALQGTGTDLLPRWALPDGNGATTSTIGGFFDATGTKRLAVLHDNGSPRRYGIVTFPFTYLP